MTDALMRKVVNIIAPLVAEIEKRRAEADAARAASKAAIDRARAAAGKARTEAEQALQRIRYDAELKVNVYGSKTKAVVNALNDIAYLQARGKNPRTFEVAGSDDFARLGTPRSFPADPQVALRQVGPMWEQAWSRLSEVRALHLSWSQKGALAKLGTKPGPLPQDVLDDIATLWAWAPLILSRVVGVAQVDLQARQAQLSAEVDRVTQLQASLTATTLAGLDQEVQAAGAVASSALTETNRTLEVTARGWDARGWGGGAVTEEVRHDIRFGTFQLEGSLALRLPEAPATLAFPFESSVVIDRFDRAKKEAHYYRADSIADRAPAAAIARGICARLLAAVPPGKLQFTFVDPVALGQSVAEFQHLADYNQDIVGIRPVTTGPEIESRLQSLTMHIENVISTYLRGQFQTIDEYNRSAGEVAEPYRILVVFDFPVGFTESSAQLLLSLMKNGPRCGLFSIVVTDPRAEWPRNVARESPLADVQTLFLEGPSGESPRVIYAGALGRVPYPIAPDPDPAITFSATGSPESPLARLVSAFGERARDSANQAVTLDRLVPVMARAIEAGRVPNLPVLRPGSPAISVRPETWWNATTAQNAVAPIGRSGAQDVTSLVFSSTDIAGGAIMVGLPRSGKSTSLHAAILTMCMLYPPVELELYLLDAKHGVEFKIYESLPHARMVSINSEREFSVAVLKSLVAEITRRAELMKSRAAGKTNITEYRQATGDKLPRIVVVMDEFHETFEEDDKLGHEAFAAFSDIVRQGPSSGVHIVVASQTLSSMPAMDRNTLKLLPERVAFMCNDEDAEIVMGVDNRGTRSLSKAGEGLFNPQRGAVAHNKPFQGVFIDSEERVALLRAIQGKAVDEGFANMPRVFDGDNQAARPPMSSIDNSATRLRVPVGEPLSLSPYEAVPLRRTREVNVLLLGDFDDAEQPDLTVRSALHSFVMAARATGASVSVIDFIGDEDGVKPDSTVRAVSASVGARYVRARGASEVFSAVAAQVDSRAEAEDYDAPTELLVLFGLHRATGLVPADTDPWNDEPSAETDATMLGRILRDGPEFGVHTVASVDSAGSVQRRLGPDILTEFSQRIGGSATTAADLAFITDTYGDVRQVRRGQLIYHDKLRGRTVRIRGYAPVVVSESEE